MAKSRSTRSNLYQLLNEAHRPIYVLDAKGRIVFANQPLCSWLGVEAAQLESLQCVWTTDRLADENLNRVRGLAAPPEMPETPETPKADSKTEPGRSRSGTAKVFRTAADGHLIWRNAEFISLSGHPGAIEDVLVCVSATDLPTNLPSTANSSTSSTHELINQLRTADAQKFRFDHFVGVSPQAQLLSRQIVVANESNCNLTIVGEDGSEREHLARAIQAARQDSKKPEEECELFSIHGAVADAQLVQTTIMQVRERAGECGWLLLVDVDRLNSEAAQELIGFLKLGDFDLRAIATCTDIEKVPPEIAERLCVLKLHIAPLRNRKMDLPLLAQMLLTEHTGEAKTVFDEAALQQIVDYDWPGNLLELKRTIEAITLNPNQVKVSKNELPERFVQALQAQQIGGPQIVEIQLDEYLADIESQLILRAMAFAGNNKAQACKLLGISRAKLGRRIQQLADENDAEEPIVFEETVDDE